MSSVALRGIESRMQALLFFNGIGLFIAGLLFGWVWFFHLLGEIVLWRKHNYAY